MSLEITRNDMDDLVPKLKRALRRSHDLTGQDLWGNLMENSPQNHGRLAGSWELRRTEDMHSTVGTNVKYALAQDQGVDPFTIFPRSAKVLRFEAGGRIVFAKKVQHPGIKGKHYVDKSIEQTNSRIAEFVSMALDGEGI